MWDKTSAEYIKNLARIKEAITSAVLEGATRPSKERLQELFPEVDAEDLKV